MTLPRRCTATLSGLTRGRILAAALALGPSPTLTLAAPPTRAVETSRSAPAAAPTAPVTARLELSSTAMQTAEDLRCTLVVDYPVEAIVALPELTESLGPFTVRDVEPAVRSRATVNGAFIDGQRRVAQSFTLWTASPGEAVIPPLSVEVRLPSGELVTASTEAVTIDVATRVDDPFDPTQFDDVMAPATLPAPRRSAGLWIAIGTALFASAIAVSASLRRLRKAEPIAEPEPHDWARGELDRLEAAQLPQRGAVDEYFVVLTTIVRDFARRRFGLEAPQQTTPEFLRSLRLHPTLAGRPRVLIGELLERADLVKFARTSAALDECTQAMRAARQLTSPPEQPFESARGNQPGSGAAEGGR